MSRVIGMVTAIPVKQIYSAEMAHATTEKIVILARKIVEHVHIVVMGPVTVQKKIAPTARIVIANHIRCVFPMSSVIFIVSKVL